MAAYLIFFEQINFLPWPSSVEISVCTDVRERKTNIQFCGFYWSHHAHLPSLPGLP